MSSVTRFLLRAYSTTTKSTIDTSLKNAKPDGSLSQAIYGERNLNKVVTKFKENSESVRFRSKKSVFQNAVLRLANAKLYNSIEEILEGQKKYKDITDEGFVSRLIWLYGKSAMFDHAYKLFEEMPQLKCERTVKSFNALLSACVNSRKYEKIDGFFHELPTKLSVKPNTRSYNIMIKALCQMGSFDSALSVVDKMENGVNPDVVTFTTLLGAFYRNNQFSDGEKVWKRMENNGIKPDVFSYHAKLEGLISEKKIQKARTLLREMNNTGLQLSAHSYNPLIKAYCDEGDLEEAKWCYNEMKMRGCKPDKLTFTFLVPLACEKNETLFAFQLAKEVIKKGFALDNALLQQVVDALVKKSKISEAKELVNLGIHNRHFTYLLQIPQ